MICKKCLKRNEDGAKFCLNCGNNLENQSPVIFCTGCFEVVDENGKFCEKCGAAIVSDFTEEKMLEKKANNDKEAIYKSALITEANNNVTQANYKASIQKLKDIAGYKDAAEISKDYEKKLATMVVKKQEGSRTRNKKVKKIGLVAIAILILFILLNQFVIKPMAINNLEESRIALAKYQNLIALGENYAIGLKSNQTVVAAGENRYGECNVWGWTDIIAIASDNYHTVGLKSDGTVVATGTNDDGQCEVSEWKNVVAIAAGAYHTVGLKDDGTVVAVGARWGSDYGQCGVYTWTNIKEIVAGDFSTIGLKNDGSVVAAGSVDQNLDDWENIVMVAIGPDNTDTGNSSLYGLKADGTMVSTDEYLQEEIKDLKNIVSINSSQALRADGKVIALFSTDDIKNQVSKWKDIVLLAHDSYEVALRADGTVAALLDWREKVKDWEGIVALTMYNEEWSSPYIVGLKSDGTVVSTEMQDVPKWSDILPSEQGIPPLDN